jgi:SDR family mycofactocin-dependent oxidoreductase
MAGSLTGKVALVTGAAQGQGRSHAIRMAEEGAELILVDICAQISVAPHPMGTPEALAETAADVAKFGRRSVSCQVDVRDLGALTEAVDAAVGELGRLDIVVANAGITSLQLWNEVTPQIWDATIGVNLTGAWHTCRAAIPHIIAGGGGSVIIINSSAGLKGLPFLLPYSVAKHGLTGLMRCLANELGPKNVRVNCIHPTGVETPMSAASVEFPRLLEALPEAAAMFANTLPVESLQPEDISSTVVFLASDQARFITGVSLPVDAGTTAR